MIESILPADVQAVQTLTHRLDVPLPPQEEAVIAGAGPQRRADFTSVRACAHDAPTALGVPPAPLLPDERGTPHWPSGIVASITHCAGYRAAAVAHARHVTAPGIDAEPNTPLPDATPGITARPEEPTALAGLPAAGPCWDRLLSSAKESVYKTWYPVTRRWPNFQETSLDLAPHGTFTARPLIPAPPELACLHGRRAAEGDHLATAVVVEAG